MVYKLGAACSSHVGKRRRNNEDNFFFNGICMPEDHSGTDNTLGLDCTIGRSTYLSVFDGIGGENYGEQASYAAARKTQESMKVTKPFFLSDKKYLENLAAELNQAVLDKAKELVTTRMGTTVAAMYFTSRYGYAMNLGDSKVYLLREGSLRQLSQDDVSSRPIATSRKAPITQYLGMDPTEVMLVPHITRIEPRPGDRYLLCTDGLSDMVREEELVEIFRQNGKMEDIAEKLIEKALENGGRDNVTLIVCEISHAEG